jgi:hypothetical protein
VSAEVVFCAIDGQQWDALDPGVRFVHGDGRWECVDEVACTGRRAEQQAGWPGMDPGLAFTEDAVAALDHAFGQMPPSRPGK